jgi:hypothetical protein
MTQLRNIVYYGTDHGPYGMPKQYFSYLVLAEPGPAAGSGVARILSLTDAKDTALAQMHTDLLVAKAGGPAAALDDAERLLTEKHCNLKKLVSEPQSDR